MHRAELSIYLIGYRDGFIGSQSDPTNTLLCFGTEECAREFIAETARERGDPQALYRVVEYAFTGRVLEG